MPSKFDIEIEKEVVKVVKKAHFEKFYISETIVKPGANFELLIQYESNDGTIATEQISFNEQELDMFQATKLPFVESESLRRIHSFSKMFHLFLIKFCRWKLTGSMSSFDLTSDGDISTEITKFLPYSGDYPKI